MISFQSKRVNLNRGLAFQKYLNVTQQGIIRIIGTLTYWDYADHERPLVWARVWICDREPDGDYILVERFSDLNGQFDSGWIVNDDGPGEDGLDIVFYFVAWNDAAQIIDPNGVRYYVIDGPYEDLPDGQYNYEAEMPRGHGAWMIFSYHNGISAGWNYLDTQTGYEAPMVTCRWPYETWPHYHPGGEIHFSDWACRWPDVILHEYGHYVMHTLYGYMPTPPGGPPPEHYINEASNNVTAWVEGWANFFPLVVFNDPILQDPWSSINLETPHWCSPNWDDGDLVEGRVAGALWDIFDSQNDSYDTFSDGFTHIWNIMQTTPCDTFHEFWQAWNTSGYPKQLALMAIFQNSIDYRGLGDLNADGVVNYLDSTSLGAAFGSKKGDTNWDQRADLTYDDRVNYLDAIILGANFGNNYDC